MPRGFGTINYKRVNRGNRDLHVKKPYSFNMNSKRSCCHASLTRCHAPLASTTLFGKYHAPKMILVKTLCDFVMHHEQ